MNKLSKKQFVMISLMLFSLFFGAGNLIFPPMAGKMAGTNMLLVMAFFAVTAVILPVLGVIAVAKTKGLQNLALRVNPVFATIFTVLIYLSIGPLLGIPRAGSLPFEMAVAPYLPSSVNLKFALFIYTLIFFSLALWLSLSPKKLVQRMGKFLTPALLMLIFTLFALSMAKGLPSYKAPVGDYGKIPFIKGFLDGYNTMDAVAALNFGFVIYLTITNFNIKDEKEIMKITGRCGALAGFILMMIYLLLADMGARSMAMFPDTENGAQILSLISKHLLGSSGAILVAAIFTLACLTTSVGLITSCSAYFTDLFKGKLSYKQWVFLWSISSLALANFGLNRILKYSFSILVVIYPISIVLVIMAMMDKFLKSNTTVYSMTIYVTMAISFVDGLSQLNINLPFVTEMFSKLPFANYQLGWALPAASAFLFSLLYVRLMQQKRDQVKAAS